MKLGRGRGEKERDKSAVLREGEGGKEEGPALGERWNTFGDVDGGSVGTGLERGAERSV